MPDHEKGWSGAADRRNRSESRRAGGSTGGAAPVWGPCSSRARSRCFLAGRTESISVALSRVSRRSALLAHGGGRREEQQTSLTGHIMYTYTHVNYRVGLYFPILERENLTLPSRFHSKSASAW